MEKIVAFFKKAFNFLAPRTVADIEDENLMSEQDLAVEAAVKKTVAEMNEAVEFISGGKFSDLVQAKLDEAAQLSKEAEQHKTVAAREFGLAEAATADATNIYHQASFFSR